MILRYLGSSPAKSTSSCFRRGVIMTTSQKIHLRQRRVIAASTAPCCYYYSTTSLVCDGESSYKPPASVLEWEKGAAKELSRGSKNNNKRNVDYLRTQRLTAEGIAMQPVYYDLNNATNPDMPGVYPYTRGPYAVRIILSFESSTVVSCR
jgi:hypothetical protein